MCKKLQQNVINVKLVITNCIINVIIYYDNHLESTSHTQGRRKHSDWTVKSSTPVAYLNIYVVAASKIQRRKKLLEKLKFRRIFRKIQ